MNATTRRVMVHVRLALGERRLIQAAAKRERRSVSSWLLMIALKEAANGQPMTPRNGKRRK